MDDDVAGLPVDPLEMLRRRRSAKWRAYDADVLPLTVAEMDFALAEPVAEVLRQAVAASDTGYATPSRTSAGPSRRSPPAAGTGTSTRGRDRGDRRRGGRGRTLRALTRPGDAVVISPPVYPPFFDWVPEAGARLLEVPLVHGPEGGGSTWPRWRRCSPPTRPPTCCAIRRTRWAGCTAAMNWPRWPGWRGSTG